MGNPSKSMVASRTPSMPRSSFEIDFWQAFSRLKLIGCTHCGFNYTTCSTENYSSTGRFTHRIIEIFIGQCVKIDICQLDQRGQFTGRKGIIHIGVSILGKFVAAGIRIFLPNKA
jgi:hypothetical protein